MATKVYEIAKGVSIASKGVILNEGEEVTAANFASEDVFNTLVRAKKIVQVTSSEKSKRKQNATPSSSTGAAEPEAEPTTPSEEDGSTNTDSSETSDSNGENV